MTLYEQCSKCNEWVIDIDYLSGIGLVCKSCSRKIRTQKQEEAGR